MSYISVNLFIYRSVVLFITITLIFALSLYPGASYNLCLAIHYVLAYFHVFERERILLL